MADSERDDVGGKEALRAYYELNPLMISSPFGGVNGIQEQLLADVLAALNISVSGRDVLDVGCGRGFLADPVDRWGGAYTGVDFVASRAGFRFALADGEALPFAADSFDLVFCVDAFEHFPNGPGAVAEFRRVLRPGGSVFLSAPNYGNVAGIVKWWCEHLGRYAKDTWAPFRQWQPQELEQCLTAAYLRRLFRRHGFNPARCIGHGPEVGLGLFPWMDHPRMPEAITFRLQRLFRTVGPAVARLCPGASLHGFWRMDKTASP